MNRPLPLSGPSPAGLPQYGQDAETAHPLPLAFFGAGYVWFLAGAAGLVLVAPDLAAGNLYSPRVFAVTHAFTLGLVTSVIFGAAHQFVPAVMGVAIRQWRVATIGFFLFEAGVAMLVVSLWRWSPTGQGVAWLLLVCGVGFGSWNTLPARRRAKRNRDVGRALSVGHSALGLVLLLAGARIGAGLGWWSVGRDALLAAHFHLGVLGFGSITIGGMGSRMLPAFFNAPAAPESRRRRFQWLASSGLLVYATGVLAKGLLLTIAGAILMALAVWVHLHMMLSYFRTRRTVLDPSLGVILLAVAGYGLALGLGLVLLVSGVLGGRVWAGYALFAIVGWLSLMAIGVMMRVVPRVTTLVAVSRGARPGTGSREGWSPHRWQWGSVALLGLGLLGMGGGVLQGNESMATVAALVFAGGAVLASSPALRWFRLGVGSHREGGGTAGT